MAEFRGLDSTLSDEELRTALYSYEGVTNQTATDNKKEGEYKLSIVSADKIEKKDSVITLSGNVEISFIKTGNNEKIVKADKIIISPEESKLSALGNAEFLDRDEEASLPSIKSDIFTYLWQEGNLYITNGATEKERNNNEGEKVSFYTTGESLTYYPSGSIIFEDGYITSNKEDVYSSIKAKKIAILNGGDMFLENATFKLGRVPFFYLPFFFYPGSRILGNPSFGFNSIKGSFLNLTFEIFGSYEKIEDTKDSSSFSSILKNSGDNKNEELINYYYSKRDKTPLESWADSSSSYLAILFDTYTGKNGSILPKGGINAALDSKINLFDDKLKFSLYSGIAFSSPVYSDKKFRYYGENSLSYSDYGFSLSLTFPFYSDSYVMRDFSSRLTSFTIDPLLGNESKFSDSKSNISSFERVLDFKYSLPSSYKPKVIDNLSISKLNVVAKYKNSENVFELQSITLPTFSFSFSGTLFSFEKYNNSTPQVEEEKEEIHTPLDSFISPLYPSPLTSTKKTKEESIPRFNFKYSLSDNLDNLLDYKEGEIDKLTLTNSLRLNLDFNFSYGEYITLGESLTPYLTNKLNNSFVDISSLNSLDVKLSSSFSLSFPFIGLSYNLSYSILSYNKEERDCVINKDELSLVKWNKEKITDHSLSFSKAFSTNIGIFTPEIKVTLHPLFWSIKPSLSYRYNNFNISISNLFNQKEKESIKSDTLSLSSTLSLSYFSYNFSLNYNYRDKEKYNIPLSSSLTLKANTKDKKYSLAEAISIDFRKKNVLSSLKTTLLLDKAECEILFSDYNNKLTLSNIKAKANFDSLSFQLWKGRIFVSFSLSSTLNLDFINTYKSKFSFSPSLIFSIAEFLDISLSLNSENNRINKYFASPTSFSLPLMFEDLLKSFDFFGNGRRETSFILKSISINLTHYMADWNLDCCYKTELIKTTAKNGRTEYYLEPSLSIALGWKTMPDLKASQNLKSEKQSDGSVKWVVY